MINKKQKKNVLENSEGEKKAIVFDASTLISLSMNGLYPELKKLKQNFERKFLITKVVWYEIIEKLLDIKKFELEALKARELVKEGILELPDSVGISKKSLDKITKELLEKANNTYNQKQGKNVELIHKGEASSISLIKELEKKGYNCLFAIDER